MQIHFVSPVLRELDELRADVIACSVWSDEWPMRGLAGILDWRLAGKISALAKRGYLTGARREVVLLPAKPRLPFDKLLVFGIGGRGDFDEASYRESVAHAKETLEGLQVRRAIIELPGRAADAIGAEYASKVALEVANSSEMHDVWWIVEPPQTAHALREMLGARRPVRRV